MRGRVKWQRSITNDYQNIKFSTTECITVLFHSCPLHGKRSPYIEFSVKIPVTGNLFTIIDKHSEG